MATAHKKNNASQSNDNAEERKIPDPVAMAQVLAKVTEKSQKIISDFLHKHGVHHDGENQFSPFKNMKMGSTTSDPANISAAFMELGKQMMTDPLKMYEAQADLMSNYGELWKNTWQNMMGEETSTLIEPEKGDRRFKDEDWTDNPWFAFIKQYYLLTSKKIQDMVGDVEGLDKKTAHKVDFYTQQYIDALSPSNFLLTNPEALRATLESGGESLLNGLENLLDDYERGEGKLSISMTDYDAFEVGKNIAVTPGKVVFQNDMFQLIQYSPSTKEVAKAPLLIMPPWINKYYILDLSPKNSFVKWAVDQGHTVFIMAWVNPDSSYRDKSFEDYMLEGPLMALDAIEKHTGEKEINMIGYCIGGTLLACQLAYMASKGDTRVKSATYFTSMLDFKDAGDLAVFIDEDQISALEERMKEHGYLSGSEMATTFNLLRSNDLIWSFVINNYLMGKEPFPFDLLYWNSDSTRMPAAMHSFYLRNMYLENKLASKESITLDGVKIDLTKIKTPSFMISTKEDHIAPWKSTYSGVNMMPNAPLKFVLSQSGHIAGVVNHPDKNKYGYWETSDNKNPAQSEKWLTKAQDKKEGSWWPAWQKWVGQYSGGQVPARDPAKGKLKVIEDAPGSYIRG